MGLIKVVVPDDIEQRFRRVAMQRFGYSKGSLSKAAVSAFASWTDDDPALMEEAKKMGDPINVIQGMLKHVKKSSVELQHEARILRGAKYVSH